MSVCISGASRLRAFQIAKMLEERDMLSLLITSMPSFRTKQYGVNKRHIKAFPAHEIIKRCWQKLPYAVRKRIDLRGYFNDQFDKLAMKHIPEDAKLFVGMSSSSLLSITRAKALGMKTIVERGAAHIQYQHDVLLEEYEKFNLPPYDVPHPLDVEREIHEYDAADYIFIPSNFVKKTFIEQGVSEKKLIVIPYGVSLKDFKPETKKDDVFRIIFCGRITIQKGVQYLLEVFKKLNLPNSELCLIGFVTEEVQSIISQYQQANIVFKGSLPENTLFHEYSQGSLFCLPSIQEGLGLVVLQAMACGLPVICTSNAGSADVVRDGIDGFTIPMRDTNALMEKITYLYEHPEERKKMGISALESAKNSFSWDDYNKKMLHAYQNILSDKMGDVTHVTK